MSKPNDDFNDLGKIIDETENAQNQNQIENVTDTPLHELPEGALINEDENGELVAEEMPDVNISGRDSGNSKKLKMVALGMVAILICLWVWVLHLADIKKIKKLKKHNKPKKL